MPCRALGGFRRMQAQGWIPDSFSRNALSGIGGGPTSRGPVPEVSPAGAVVMPCRALGGFRWRTGGHLCRADHLVVMPCRALGGFRFLCASFLRSGSSVVMPCRALGGFRPSAIWRGGSLRLRRRNALSGIGGVPTALKPANKLANKLGRNALSGIGGVPIHNPG